jgi:hypothetical protein
MSINLGAERYRFELCAAEKTMRRQKVIRTTLGDLIAAVTDEVKPFVHDPSRAYLVVSYILNHILARYRVRAADQAASR